MWGVVVLCIFFIVWYLFRKPRLNLPPGPPIFPVIGSAGHVIKAGSSRPSIAFQTLARTYGPVFYVEAGNTPIVVVNDHKSLAEVAAKDEFTDRLPDKWMIEKSYGCPLGILMSRTHFWKQTRNFTSKLLTKYGFNNKSTLEKHIIEEVKEFIVELKDEVSSNGGTVLLEKQFNGLFFNATWTLVTNQRLSLKDPILGTIINATNKLSKSSTIGWGLAFLHPRLASMLSFFTGFKEHQKICQELCQLFEKIVAERRLVGAFKESPNNFIDDFLCEIERTGGNIGNLQDSIFTDKNLQVVLQDLALAGNETSSNVMKFVIRYLLRYPEVYVKLQGEVDLILGSSRYVTADDIPRLVYTQATLFEVLRVANVTPMTFRASSCKTKIGDYDIPQDTQILFNLLSANCEASIWENPYEFKPERFLNTEGELVNTGKIASFGLGKRKCIADQFAKTNITLVLATLIQQLDFQVDPSFGMPSEQDIPGFATSTVPFNVRIKTRHFEFIDSH